MTPDARTEVAIQAWSEAPLAARRARATLDARGLAGFERAYAAIHGELIRRVGQHFTLAELAEAGDDAGHAVLAVEAENLAGKASGGLHLAFGEFEQEQPLDQHRIGGVEFERLPEIIGGEIIVAELAGQIGRAHV